MQTIWFCLVAIMIAMYVVLDGFDLGAGAIHLWVARDDGERQQVIRSIGPVWDGNEVWLLAAGGTLYFAFPALYASGFSGFYLPLMIVLWLLILRGIAVEFRGHIDSPVWLRFWDVVFAGASLLLAVFFGAALGNVVRGVPLNRSRVFLRGAVDQLPLGTEHRHSGLVHDHRRRGGARHAGAAWRAVGGAEDRRPRARSLLQFGARRVVGRPGPHHRAHRDYIQGPARRFPRISSPIRGVTFSRRWRLSGLAGMVWFMRKRDELKSFLASCAYIVGMLTSVVFGLYPLVLPASTNPAYSLTVDNAKAADYGLRVGLAWWIVGMILVAAYTTTSTAVLPAR